MFVGILVARISGFTAFLLIAVLSLLSIFFYLCGCVPDVSKINSIIILAASINLM
jgi:hypothetical protein